MTELDSTLSPSPTKKTDDETDDFQSWALSVPISIPPDLSNPILEALTYDIRYTSFKAGNVVVQTDIVVSNGVEVAEGIITGSAELALYPYYDSGETRRSEGYTPPVLDGTIGTRLSSRPSLKGPDISGWCDYIDHHELYPGARILGTPSDNTSMIHVSHIYLFFHVYQGCCSGALRSIDVDITATWSDGNELRRSEEKKKGIDEIRRERERLIRA